MSVYKRSVAVTYAEKWCSGFNPAYPSQSNFHGTDCTNFVSQCLHQGGCPTTSGNVLNRADNEKWWYGGNFGTGTSYSWEQRKIFASF